MVGTSEYSEYGIRRARASEYDLRGEHKFDIIGYVISVLAS